MRRKDREVTNKDEIADILERSTVVRIAMVDNGEPYVIPMNFGYELDENDKISIYIHSAKDGRKTDIFRNSPRICFETDIYIGTTTGTLPCQWSADFESIIGYGNISFIEEKADKIHAMNMIMKHYKFDGELVYGEVMLSRTNVLRIDVEELSAKRNIKNKE